MSCGEDVRQAGLARPFGDDVPLRIAEQAADDACRARLSAAGPVQAEAFSWAKAARATDVLFVVSFRFYATEVVNVAEETAARGVPILAITDSTLSSSVLAEAPG